MGAVETPELSLRHIEIGELHASAILLSFDSIRSFLELLSGIKPCNYRDVMSANFSPTQYLPHED